MSGRTLTLLVDRKPQKVGNFQKSNLLAWMLLAGLQDFWNARRAANRRVFAIASWSARIESSARMRESCKRAVTLHLLQDRVTDESPSDYSVEIANWSGTRMLSQGRAASSSMATCRHKARNSKRGPI